MRITVKYLERWYGNTSSEPPGSRVIVSDVLGPDRGVQLDIQFAGHAAGRGLDWENRGDVKGAKIVLSTDEARKIATAILWQLHGEADGSVELTFKRKKKT